jgi:hypothetical protein
MVHPDNGLLSNSEKRRVIKPWKDIENLNAYD